MKPCHHEKDCTKLWCTHGVPPGSHAFIDNQLRPLEGLHAHEGGTENCCCKQQPEGGHFVFSIAEINSQRHGATARD